MSTTLPASGWYCEVTDPSSNYTHQAPVVTGEGRSVSPNRKANGRPTIRVPVRKSDKWQNILGDGSSDVDFDVWFAGVRFPIDTLDDVEQAPGATVLVGSGGRELETRIEDSIDQEAVHTAANRLVTNNTAYTSNADTPTTSTTTNATLVSGITSNSDFLTRLVRPPLDTEPWEVASGNLKFKGQTCFTQEGENADRSTNSVTGSDTNFSEGSSANVTDDEVYEWDFGPLQYDVPEGEFEFAYRNDATGTSVTNVEWFLESKSDNSLSKTKIADTNDDTSLNWEVVDQDNGFADANLATISLTEGVEYTLYAEAKSSDTDTRRIDVVAPRDRRFTYNDDNAVDSDNGNLDGPGLFPTGTDIQIRFDIIAAPEAVTGARAEATLNSDDNNDFTHHLSNDQGANFTTGDNSGGAFETDSLGASFGPGVTYKASIAATGQRSSTTPKQGFTNQELQSLTLKADLEDMPIVVNTTFDGALSAVLTELASIGDQLWAYERDGSTESIEFTSPGQRTSTKDPQINDYVSTKTVGQVYQKAAVYGQPDVNVTGERFESNHGTAVSLLNDRVQQGSELVTDPDTGERFSRNLDYTMDYQAGEITVLAAGDMADASTFAIDYEYQPFGEFDDGTASPDVVDVNIPGLTTDYACEQAAQLIVNEVNTPLHTAEVTLPNDDPEWSVVESLDPSIVPTGGNALHVRQVVNTPEQTVLTLGSRRGLDDVVEDIRTQVGAVSRPA